MNKERILALADAIEKGSIKNLEFDMITYYTHIEGDKFDYRCNTRACLAGWATLLKREIDNVENLDERNFNALTNFHGAKETAKEWLELDRDTANFLFLSWKDGQEENRDLAVRVLRRLVETGKVDWEDGEEHESDPEEVN